MGCRGQVGATTAGRDISVVAVATNSGSGLEGLPDWQCGHANFASGCLARPCLFLSCIENVGFFPLSLAGCGEGKGRCFLATLFR
jgi:hypothetical protein